MTLRSRKLADIPRQGREKVSMARNFALDSREGDELETGDGQKRRVVGIHDLREGVRVVYRATQPPGPMLLSVPLREWSEWVLDNDARLIIQRRK